MVDWFKKLTWKVKLGGLLGLVLLASLLYNWYTPSKELPVGVVVTAKENKQAAKVEKVEVVMQAPLKGYDKSRLAKYVKLTPEVINNPNAVVTKVADVEPSKAGTIVTSVTDVKTGETTLHEEAKQLPFWSFENEKRLGLGYSMGSKHGEVIDVHAEYTFARTGSVYYSVRGEANTLGEVKGTVNLEYRPQ